MSQEWLTDRALPLKMSVQGWLIVRRWLKLWQNKRLEKTVMPGHSFKHCT